MQVTLPQTSYVPYGAPGAVPPTQAVIATVAPHREAGLQHSQQKSMRILSAMQIAIGIMCIIIYIVLLAIKERERNGYFDRHGAGFWCGGIFIIAGSLGIAAARQNRLSLIIAAMTLSIISSILLWVLLSVAAVAISQSDNRDDYDCSYERYYYSSCVPYNFSGFKAADSILVILALAEFIVSVWSAVLGCRGSCKSCCSYCCYGSSYGYQPSTIYYAPAQSGGAQVILLPHTGMVGGQAIGMVSSQPGSFGMQQPVLFAHPAAPVAAAAAAVSGYQPCVVARPPEYSTLLVDSAVPTGAAGGQSGEATKDQFASGGQQV